MKPYTAIIEGRESQVTGCEDIGTKTRLTLADGRTFIFEGMEPDGSGFMGRGNLIEIALLRRDTVHSDWLFNGESLRQWYERFHAAQPKRKPSNGRFPPSLVSDSDWRRVMLHLEPPNDSDQTKVTAVAWFANDESPVWLDSWRKEVQPEAQTGAMPGYNFQKGAFSISNNWTEVRHNGKLYDLSPRHQARYCLRYLVEKKAFTPQTALPLTEIDSYVRKATDSPKATDIRIHHYFNGNKSLVSLRKAIVINARRGRYYIKLD